ncbi:MAG: hypothetical protein KTR31_07915 [Myxococcales bacterium]|nr:hypothetical protein [Myxococcales bacterium]
MSLRERNKARRRRAVVEAVRSLLREDPEVPLTKERIARRAEVAPATLYNLIGTRAELWASMAEAFTDALQERLEGFSAHPPLQRCCDVVQQTVELILEDPAVHRAMLLGLRDASVVLRRGPLTLLRQAIDDALVAELLLADAPVTAMVQVIRLGCLGACLEWCGGRLDDDALHRATRRVVCLALLPAVVPPERDRWRGLLERSHT